MSDKIKLDIVSDVVCPWCIIGYKRLEQAIDELGIQDKIELEWQPFQLNPQMPIEGENINEHLAKKYGTSVEDGKRTQANLTKLGEELGFTFNFAEDMRMVNTSDAHVVLDYAKEKGKQTELNIRLIEAHFSENRNVSDRNVLMQEVEAVGLNREEALAWLTKEASKSAVQRVEESWKSRGVNSVPTVVINNTSGVTGAQSVEVYKNILSDLLAK